jgi:hypothetical protein
VLGLLGLLAGSFVVQELFVALDNPRPWPGYIMPGFGEPIEERIVIDVPNCSFRFHDGSVRQVAAAQVFGSLAHRTLPARAFRSDNARVHAPGTVEYLRRKARRLFPGREAVWFQVSWDRVVLRPDGTRNEKASIEKVRIVGVDI